MSQFSQKNISFKDFAQCLGKKVPTQEIATPNRNWPLQLA
jgi:hypothetical protein